MDPYSESRQVEWTDPKCPFKIVYSAAKLDDIRLAVVDAYFSLPRGGAEIGGILLGGFRDGVLRIADYAPFECEHATGPSFTLSDNDHLKLHELLTSLRQGASGRQPVGWYHSHTRSEIFLSEPDLDIHSLYFPEPHHVALILKPHNTEPTRAGFFFREVHGGIRSDAAYTEFELNPLSVRPPAPPPQAPAQEPDRWRKPDPEGPVVTVESQAAPIKPAVPVGPLPPPPPQSAPPPAEFRPREEPQTPPPAFLQPVEEEGSRRRIVGLLAAALVLAAVGGGAYYTRDKWYPKGKAKPPAVATQAKLGLNATDAGGQLQIKWDSAAMQTATMGTLEIRENHQTKVERLDPAHLRAGSFTYARQSDRVDIALTVMRAAGKPGIREATSFVGQPPAPPAENKEAAEAREAAAKQAAEFKAALDAQNKRTKKLEKSMDDVLKQLRRQQQQRLRNQDAEPPR